MYKKISTGWLDLFRFSVLVGWRWPWTRLGLTRLLVPMDIARYFELPETLKVLEVEKGDVLLDLSSPKLLAAYIANKIGAKVIATDIWRQEVVAWRRLLEKADLCPTNLKLEVVDGRKLPYSKNSFDKIFSVSVLEHIEKDGDRKAVKELARVLKPGGKLVFTVPISHKEWSGYRQSGIYGQEMKGGKKIFWARRYDMNSLKRRLIHPSGLRLVRTVIAWEKYPIFSQWHAQLLPWSGLFGWLYPLLAMISLRETENYLSKEVGQANVMTILEKV